MKDRLKIVVVGLAVGVERLAIVRRRKRMNDASINARFLKGCDNRLVVDACHFDRRDEVNDAFGFTRGLNLLRHRSETTRVVLDGGGLDNDTSEIIA